MDTAHMPSRKGPQAPLISHDSMLQVRNNCTIAHLKAWLNKEDHCKIPRAIWTTAVNMESDPTSVNLVDPLIFAHRLWWLYKGENVVKRIDMGKLSVWMYDHGEAEVGHITADELGPPPGLEREEELNRERLDALAAAAIGRLSQQQPTENAAPKRREEYEYVTLVRDGRVTAPSQHPTSDVRKGSKQGSVPPQGPTPTDPRRPFLSLTGPDWYSLSAWADTPEAEEGQDSTMIGCSSSGDDDTEDDATVDE